MSNGESSWGDIRAIASGFRASRILLSAYELGIFTALGDEEKTAEQVAESIGTDTRATDRLMNALCAIGLLEKNGTLFGNGEAASRSLVEGKPDYMAGLGHYVNLWDRWSTLTEAVHAGGAVTARPVGERGEEWLRSFIGAMHDRGVRQAPSTIASVDLAGVSRVLDVGGGPGDFAMAFVRASDTITATVFDLPQVVPLTREYIEEAGLTDRVDTRAGDFLTDDLGSGYDLIYLSAIVHSLSPDECRFLFRKCVDALEPGGRVVLQDWVMSEDRIEPAEGALFAINMLVNTRSGDSYTERELHSWLSEAGLVDMATRETPSGSAQVTGRKPSGDQS